MAQPMLVIDGAAVPLDPASMKVTREQVNASDAGRDQSGTMHTNRVCVKRKIELSWVIVHEANAAAILRMVEPEHISVQYWDPFDNRMETRTFYTGEHSADMRSFRVPCVGGTTYKTIALDMIEV